MDAQLVWNLRTWRERTACQDVFTSAERGIELNSEGLRTRARVRSEK
ncbi:hypothetical protein [Lysobacter sp. P5_B9]